MGGICAGLGGSRAGADAGLDRAAWAGLADAGAGGPAGWSCAGRAAWPGDARRRGGAPWRWGCGRFLVPPRPAAGDRPVIRLVQPNAPQRGEMGSRARRRSSSSSARSTRPPPRAVPDLVVWPETAIPYLPGTRRSVLTDISDAAGGVPVVLGVQRRGGGLAYNSLTVMEPAGEIGAIYDKHHLVPFGEYMPDGPACRACSGCAASPRAMGMATARDPGRRSWISVPSGHRLPLICYEAIFPQDARHRSAARPPAPDHQRRLVRRVRRAVPAPCPGADARDRAGAADGARRPIPASRR
jgi:apolipoprotein N-acyltransferase